MYGQIEDLVVKTAEMLYPSIYFLIPNQMEFRICFLNDNRDLNSRYWTTCLCDFSSIIFLTILSARIEGRK
jgi:hypothetical protein